MLSIEISGTGVKGAKAELAVLLEYFLMNHGYKVERGNVYQRGLNDMERAQILQKSIASKSTNTELQSISLDVVI